jgi:hypothetical protein
VQQLITPLSERPEDWAAMLSEPGYEVIVTSGVIETPYGNFARGRLEGEWPFEDRTNDNQEIWFDAHGRVTVPTQQMVEALDTVLTYEEGGELSLSQIRAHNAFVAPFLESGQMPANANHPFVGAAASDYSVAALRLIPEDAAEGPDRSQDLEAMRRRAELQKEANAANKAPPRPSSPEAVVTPGEPSRVGDVVARRSEFDQTRFEEMLAQSRATNEGTNTDVVLVYALRDPATQNFAIEEITLPPDQARSLIWRLDEAELLTASRDEVFRSNGIGGHGTLADGRENNPENNLRFRDGASQLLGMTPEQLVAAAQQGALRINGKEGAVFPLEDFPELSAEARALNADIGPGDDMMLVIPREYRVSVDGVTRNVRAVEVFPELTREEAKVILNSVSGFRNEETAPHFTSEDFSAEDSSLFRRDGEADPIAQILEDNNLVFMEGMRDPEGNLERQADHWVEEYRKRRRRFPLESEEQARRRILEQIEDPTVRAIVAYLLRAQRDEGLGVPTGASAASAGGSGGGGNVNDAAAAPDSPDDEGTGDIPQTGSPLEMPRSLFNPQPEAMAEAMEQWKAMVEEGIANGETLEEIIARIAPEANTLAGEIFPGTPIATGYGMPRDAGGRTTDLTHRLFEANLEPTLDFVERDWENVVNARTGESPSFPASELRERLEAGDPEVFELVHVTRIQTPSGEVDNARINFLQDTREGSRGYRVVTSYPSDPETISSIREALSQSWEAVANMEPGDPAVVDAAARFFHDYIHLYWHMHGNDEIATSLLAGLMSSKGFPIEALNPDASLSGGAFQSSPDEFVERFRAGDFARLGNFRVDAGSAETPQSTEPARTQDPAGTQERIQAPAEQQRPATSEIAERYIAGGTFTRAEYERILPLNPDMTPDKVAQELAMEKQGFGSGRLVTQAPRAEPARATGAAPVETVDLGQRPDLVDEARTLLDETIARAGEPGAENDERILDKADMAEQIARMLESDPDKVVATLDDEGRIVGLGAYEISRNVFDPAQSDILYAEALLRFDHAGGGIAPALLDAMFERAPRGIMRLRSLNSDLDDYYECLGGRAVDGATQGQRVYEWREPPGERPGERR